MVCWNAELLCVLKDVYRDILGLSSSRPPKFEEEIFNEFKRLDRTSLKRKLTSIEKKKLSSLKEQVLSLPGTDPLALLTELYNLAEELRKIKGDGR